MRFVRSVAFVLGLISCLFVGGCGAGGSRAEVDSRRENAPADKPVAKAKADPGHRSAVHRVSGSPVTATLSLEPAQAQRGNVVLLTVKLEIEPLWEVRALDEQQAAEATRFDLKLPAGVAADGNWQAPRATRSIAPDGHTVYVGDAEFRQKLRVTSGSSTGELPIKCGLHYQACNDQQCLAPAEVELAVVLRVQ
jgi:hypothetical protein